MDKLELLKRVNQAEYKIDCVKAWALAPKIGQSLNLNKEKSFNSSIPHDISDYLWSNNHISNCEKLDLLFELYEDMPCYAYLMYLFWEFKNSFNDLEKKTTLIRFRAYISGDIAALSEPIIYSLWCDYFENEPTSHNTWNILVNNDFSNINLMDKLLRICGPLPWKLKSDLIEKVVEVDQLHTSIYKSIYFSAHDVYGQIDKPDAIRILLNLKTLELNDEIESLIKVLS